MVVHKADQGAGPEAVGPLGEPAPSAGRGGGKVATGRSNAGEGQPDSRGQILDAALRLFADGGFGATSTERIAQEAGVTRTLIFHYFPTKQAILVTLLHERSLMSSLDRVEVPAPDGGVQEALLALAERIREALAGLQPLVQLVLHEQSIRSLTGILYREFMDHLQGLVAATLAAATGLPPTEPTIVDVADTFTAALVRDVLLNPFLGVTEPAEPLCLAAARTAALALATVPGRAEGS